MQIQCVPPLCLQSVFRTIAPPIPWIDLNTIKAAAELENELATFPGTFDISNNFKPGKQEKKVRIKEGSRSIGITMRDLARQIRQAFYGEEVQRIQRRRDEIRVMVRYPVEERRSLANLEDKRIRTAGLLLKEAVYGNFGIYGFGNLKRN